MSKLVLILSLCVLVLDPAARSAVISVGSWIPVFKGVELASGQQQAQTASELDQQVLCLRVDLTDPDISLFTTPHCTNCVRDTLSENTSHFVETFGVQAAINGGFYTSSGGVTDTELGTPENVYGLSISQGELVSTAMSATYTATMLFTADNQAFYLPNNWPATNTTGIYTAITGNRALLTRGVNVNPSTPADLDPRTALGLSQDRRFLFLMTIDGRQPGWSDGADFRATGEWLKRFGASDGINLDGGGSTTMVLTDCVGNPVCMNKSSYVAAYGRERIIGQNLGLYASPLPSGLREFQVQPGSTTAILTWTTDTPSTTQVEYGPSASYGSATPLDSRLVRNHVATLAGLTPGSTCYYRAVSTANGTSLTQACQFSTFPSGLATQVFEWTQVWAYTTNNLDGAPWTTYAYDDTAWLGQGPGLLYVENSTYVTPKNTQMPPTYGQAIPPTYYFRTHFPFTGNIDGTSLTLTNHVDDGAVYHLNGSEVYRLRMPEAPTPIVNATSATGTPCTGDAHAGDAVSNCPDVFTLSGSLLASLAQGDNVLAVEVHNYSASKDLVFGCSLVQDTPLSVVPQLHLAMEEDTATLYWNGEGFTLQHASDLSASGSWSDVPGPVTQSPFVIANGATTFYRLSR